MQQRAVMIWIDSQQNTGSGGAKMSDEIAVGPQQAIDISTEHQSDRMGSAQFH
jgi:hypothetical protein